MMLRVFLEEKAAAAEFLAKRRNAAVACLFLGFAVLFASQAQAQAQAQAPAQAQAQEKPRLPVDRAGTYQKIKFLNNLVSKSVAAKTIEESGDRIAQSKLEEARALVRQAQVDLDAGRTETANGKLNQALSLVNAQTRRLSNGRAKRLRQREDYDRHLQTVETFLKAYERVAGEKEISATAQTHVAEIRGIVTKAKSLAAHGDLPAANSSLRRAYRIARGDIREMRQGKILTRSLDFKTPADEYRYEKDRNDSHFMLLKFALAEKKPPENFVVRIKKLEDQARRLRRAAEEQAKAGQHPKAIDIINRSTDELLRAIRMSGIYVPS